MSRRVRFSPLCVGLLGGVALVSSPPCATAIEVPFTDHTISAAALGAYSVFAADVDGDGDTDVLSALRNAATIAWYENDQPFFGDGFESGDTNAWSSTVP